MGTHCTREALPGACFFGGRVVFVFSAYNMQLAARAPISYAELHQRTIASRRRSLPAPSEPTPRASPFAVNPDGVRACASTLIGGGATVSGDSLQQHNSAMAGPRTPEKKPVAQSGPAAAGYATPPRGTTQRIPTTDGIKSGRLNERSEPRDIRFDSTFHSAYTNERTMKRTPRSPGTTHVSQSHFTGGMNVHGADPARPASAPLALGEWRQLAKQSLEAPAAGSPRNVIARGARPGITLLAA